MLEVNRINKAIEADANGRCRYYSKNGRLCVIAGLVEALPETYNKSSLRSLLTHHNKNSVLHLSLVGVVAALSAYYGLDSRQLRTLQSINDTCSHIKGRRESMLEYIAMLGRLQPNKRDNLHASP